MSQTSDQQYFIQSPSHIASLKLNIDLIARKQGQINYA
jgi:hypothetical protein